MNEYKIFKNYGILIITSNKFGKFNIKIDLSDIKRCQKYTWSINSYSNKVNSPKVFYYASNSKAGLLHGFIIKCPKNKEVDHINRNTLDNRKKNLRITNRSQNNINRDKQSNNTSGHKGVFWSKWVSKWVGHIRKNGNQKILGYFDKIENAILARESAEKEMFS